MGTKGREIVGVDVEELVKMLNKALADEWLAYYQYWVGARIAAGRMRGLVAEELEEHATEELEHADLLVERISQLGGTPLTHPSQWLENTNCAYEEPTNPSTLELLKQNIRGEQCAISVYQKIYEFVAGKDPITERLVVKILEDEVEHEEDLEAILEDMQFPVK